MFPNCHKSGIEKSVQIGLGFVGRGPGQGNEFWLNQIGAGVNMSVYAAPLDSALWFKRIEIIANGSLASVENSLRHASHLLQLTPLELRPLVGLAIDPDSFEALLDSGNLDTAARHLVARPTALDTEGEAGAPLIRATIRCSALNRKVHGIGDSVAKAVLNAWSTCLLCLREQYGDDLSGLSQQSSGVRLRDVSSP